MVARRRSAGRRRPGEMSLLVTGNTTQWIYNEFAEEGRATHLGQVSSPGVRAGLRIPQEHLAIDSPAGHGRLPSPGSLMNL